MWCDIMVCNSGIVCGLEVSQNFLEQHDGAVMGVSCPPGLGSSPLNAHFLLAVDMIKWVWMVTLYLSYPDSTLKKYNMYSIAIS